MGECQVEAVIDFDAAIVSFGEAKAFNNSIHSRRW